MAELVYTAVPGKIKTLLGKVPSVGIPPRVTVQWLKTIGFTSSNDSTLIGVLKLIGFIDQGGVPTDRWTQFRGPQSKKVLGEAIRAGYADLYAIYPEAEKCTRAELEGVFSTSTKGGKVVINKLVSTFRSLADEAEFDGAPATTHQSVTGAALHAPPAANTAAATSHVAGGPSLHIDIQVHISADSAPEQIEQIFASMAKHLYGGRGGG